MSATTRLYDSEFFDDNVYGHALELLARNFNAPDVAGSVLLDIGSGSGRIAEPVSDRLGLGYIGVDSSPAACEALRDRGLESHEALLQGEFDADLAALRKIVGSRKVAAITFLDTLEHVPNPAAILNVLSALAHEHRCDVIISVPNITHWNVGFKLAFGLWDYTEEGILDHTHLTFFSRQTLSRILQQSGLRPYDQNDVMLENSDQNFPADHPALSSGTVLNKFLRRLRKSAAPDDTVNQFVVICASSSVSDVASLVTPSEADESRPFLSVVVRTQGKRRTSLVEVLTSLTAQEDQDFEVLVLGHRLDLNDQKAVERIIEDVPAGLRERISLIRVDHGNRVVPLNVGFENAKGRYIAILDDDDIPMAHWVQEFRSLAARHPGQILRAGVVRQDIRSVVVNGMESIRAEGPLDRPYPSHFDFLEHLSSNSTPPVSIAFPRGAFHSLNIRFDETLATTEDWDYLMRVAAVTGVASSPEITSIYHWWVGGESSRTVHSQAEWDKSYSTILAKFDESIILLPDGLAIDIRNWLAERRALHAKAAAGDLGSINGRSERLYRVLDILESRSWRVTGLLRWPSRLFRHGTRIRARDYVLLDEAALDRVIRDLETSRSWQLTGIFRRR